MINHPAIIALVAWSLLGSLALAGAAFWALRILRRWDPRSATEEQILLERGTFLVSTLLTFTLAFQVLSFFLFILTAEELHGRFVGAMCAAGTLFVDAYGYPALALKVLNAVLGGAWLCLNHVDGLGHDYPLIRVKYRLLLVLAPLMLLGEGIQVLYFAGLKADVITSCCGSLFGQGGPGLASELASMPAPRAGALLAGASLLVLLAGLRFLLRRKGALALAGAAVAWGAAGAVFLVSVVSTYVYELPTHHCPFCMLKPEYRGVGYAFLGLLLAEEIAACALGVLAALRPRPSLEEAMPRVQRRLGKAILVSAALFLALSACVIVLSNYRAG